MSGAIANLMALHTLSRVRNILFDFSFRLKLTDAFLFSLLFLFVQVPRSQFQKQIIFGFLDAENWGYVGSERLIRDLTGGFSCEERGGTWNQTCNKPPYPSLEFLKIPFQGTSAILEVKQVGKVQHNGGASVLWRH